MAKTVESDSSFPSRGSPDTDASVKLIPSSRNWKASSKLCSVLLNKCQSLEIAKWHFVGYPSCKIITTLSINSGILSQYPHLMSHTAGLLRQRWSLLHLPQTSEAQEDKQSHQDKCESFPNREGNVGVLAPTPLQALSQRLSQGKGGKYSHVNVQEIASKTNPSFHQPILISAPYFLWGWKICCMRAYVPSKLISDVTFFRFHLLFMLSFHKLLSRVVVFPIYLLSNH